MTESVGVDILADQGGADADLLRRGSVQREQRQTMNT